MTYTLISNSKKDAGAIVGYVRSWDDVVREATFKWMVGRPVKDVVLWLRRYQIGWSVRA